MRWNEKTKKKLIKRVACLFFLEFNELFLMMTKNQNNGEKTLTKINVILLKKKICVFIEHLFKKKKL